MNETQLLNLWTPACAGVTEGESGSDAPLPPLCPLRRASGSLLRHETCWLNFLKTHKKE